MKKNINGVSQVKLLRIAYMTLSKYANSFEIELNDDEWFELKENFAKSLQTNILFLNWEEQDALITELEHGRITNSKAERIAEKGGKIDLVCGKKDFIVMGTGVKQTETLYHSDRGRYL
tara:strand:- start:956 stop:1312 length:357 start_codon:yes stop_codon:yes gene_type:complete